MKFLPKFNFSSEREIQKFRFRSIERKSRKLEPGVTKLVVFDFDQTISIVHMFHILFGQGCPSEPLQVAAIQNPEKVSTEKSPVTFCESLLGGQDRVEEKFGQYFGYLH